MVNAKHNPQPIIDMYAMDWSIGHRVVTQILTENVIIWQNKVKVFSSNGNRFTWGWKKIILREVLNLPGEQPMFWSARIKVVHRTQFGGHLEGENAILWMYQIWGATWFCIELRICK